MKENKQRLNAYVSLNKVSKNGRNFNNIIVSLPTEKGEISFQVKLAFYNSKLLYKIGKQLEESEKQ